MPKPPHNYLVLDNLPKSEKLPWKFDLKDFFISYWLQIYGASLYVRVLGVGLAFYQTGWYMDLHTSEIISIIFLKVAAVCLIKIYLGYRASIFTTTIYFQFDYFETHTKLALNASYKFLELSAKVVAKGFVHILLIYSLGQNYTSQLY